MDVVRPARYVERNQMWNTDSRTGITSYIPNSVSAPIFGGSITNTYNQNPNWKVQVAKGVDASTAYRREEYKGRPPILEATARYFGNGYTLTSKGKISWFGNIPAFADVEDTVLRDQALAKVKGKLRQQIGTAELMAPTAELRELRGLVRQAVDYTFGLFRQVREIKRGGPREILRKASDLYLGYSFGIAPMVGDINNALGAMDSYLQGYSKPIHFRGKTEKDWYASTTTAGHTLNNGMTATCKTHEHHVLSYRYTSCYDLNIHSANSYSFSDHLGLNLANVIPSLWELTTFSWVADYFGTIGDYLEDVFYTPPADLKYLVLNKKYVVTVDYFLSPVLSIPSGYKASPEGYSRPGRMEYLLFKRTPLAKLPVRALRFKTLDEVGFNSLKKLLNLTAILTK